MQLARPRRIKTMHAEALSRRLIAEGIGSVLLTATVVGSGIMAQRLAGGNVAVALLASREISKRAASLSNSQRSQTRIWTLILKPSKGSLL